MLEVMAALTVMIGVAMWAAYQGAREVRESIAEATGRYMLSVRGATLELLSEQYAVMTGVDTSAFPAGTVAPKPAWLTPSNSFDITIAQLKTPRSGSTMGYLNSGFPDATQFGGPIRVRVTRSGACPGTSCRVDALVYTTREEKDLGLVTKAVKAADGYGGYSVIGNANRIRGGLFEMANPAGNVPGVVGVVASLDTTMFNQFVRQGDTRHVYLNNLLSVEDRINTNTGVAMNTDVTTGGACSVNGMYATNSRGTMATCTGGRWFEMNTHVVQGVLTGLAHGATVPAASCPGPGMTPFVMASLESTDVTISGSSINVYGNLTGSVAGSGTVNSSGSVSVNGSLTGTMQSTSASSIRVGQRVLMSGNTVQMSPTGTNARATAIYGCRYS